MIEERRHHARLVPGSPLFVSLDEARSGLLLDVCEGGVAVASIVPRNLDEVISLAFDLPEGRGHVEAKAEIAWIRDAGHLTGARFVDVDITSRQQLGAWICDRENRMRARSAETSEPVFVTRSTYAQADPDSREASETGAAAALRASLAAASHSEEHEEKPAQILTEIGLSGAGKSRHTIELILAVVLLSWALVYLGYQMGSTGWSRIGHDLTGTSKAVETPIPSKTLVGSVEASPSPASNPPVSPALSVGDSGVVLQVGAMKVEENADAMAQDLQKKNFPAFVFRHGGDKLYKVAVGPFGDADSSGKAKESLEKLGFKPISRPWLPE